MMNRHFRAAWDGFVDGVTAGPVRRAIRRISPETKLAMIAAIVGICAVGTAWAAVLRLGPFR